MKPAEKASPAPVVSIMFSNFNGCISSSCVVVSRNAPFSPSVITITLIPKANNETYLSLIESSLKSFSL